MRINEKLHHAASVEEVFEMLSNRAFQELRCERSGSVEHEVTIEEPVDHDELNDGDVAEDGGAPGDQDADGPTVVTRRRMTTDEFPDFAKKLIGQTIDIIETTRWGAAASDGTREAAYTLSVEGTPVNAVGGVHLRPSAEVAAGGGQGAVTTHTVDGELNAHIPFIGAKVERVVRPFVTKAIELEAELGREWLGR